MVKILALLAIVTAYFYLWFATPIYEAMAIMIIKDENKGVGDAELLDAINPFESKKIVENEIEVIKSRGVMNQVVRDLLLYSGVYHSKKNLLGKRETYETPPILFELNDSDIISSLDENQQVLKILISSDGIVSLKNKEIILG